MESRGREYDSLVVAFLHFAQTGIDIPPDRLNI
jgi:hypothetical protein